MKTSFFKKSYASGLFVALLFQTLSLGLLGIHEAFAVKRTPQESLTLPDVLTEPLPQDIGIDLEEMVPEIPSFEIPSTQQLTENMIPSLPEGLDLPEIPAMPGNLNIPSVPDFSSALPSLPSLPGIPSPASAEAGGVNPEIQAIIDRADASFQILKQKETEATARETAPSTPPPSSGGGGEGVLGSLTGGLSKSIGGVTGGLGEAASGLAGGLGDTVSGLSDGIGGTVSGLTGGLTEAASGLTSGSLGGAVSGLTGGVGTALTGVAGGVGDTISGLTSGLGGAVSGLTGGIGTALSGVTGGLGGALSGIAGSVGTGVGGGLGNLVSGMGNLAGSAVSSAGGMLGGITSAAGNLAGGAIGSVGALAEGAIGGASNLVGGAVEGAGSLVNGAVGSVGNLATGNLSGAVGSLTDGVGGAVKGLGGGLGGAVTGVAGGVGEAAQTATQSASGAANDLFGAIGELRNISIKQAQDVDKAESNVKDAEGKKAQAEEKVVEAEEVVAEKQTAVATTESEVAQAEAAIASAKAPLEENIAELDEKEQALAEELKILKAQEEARTKAFQARINPYQDVLDQSSLWTQFEESSTQYKQSYIRRAELQSLVLEKERAYREALRSGDPLPLAGTHNDLKAKLSATETFLGETFFPLEQKNTELSTIISQSVEDVCLWHSEERAVFLRTNDFKSDISLGHFQVLKQTCRTLFDRYQTTQASSAFLDDDFQQAQETLSTFLPEHQTLQSQIEVLQQQHDIEDVYAPSEEAPSDLSASLFSVQNLAASLLNQPTAAKAVKPTAAAAAAATSTTVTLKKNFPVKPEPGSDQMKRYRGHNENSLQQEIANDYPSPPYLYEEQILAYEAIMKNLTDERKALKKKHDAVLEPFKKDFKKANEDLAAAQADLQAATGDKEALEKAVDAAQEARNLASKELAKKKEDEQTTQEAINRLASQQESLKTLMMSRHLKELGRQTASFDLSNLRADPDSSQEHLLVVSSQDDDGQRNVLNRFITVLITTISTFGVFMLVVAAFFMIGSEGDQNRLQKGKSIFLHTIIGLVVAFTSYMLVQFVLTILFS